MSDTGNKNREALDRLADELVEDILSATDQEVESEAKQDFGNVAKAATPARAAFDRALLNVAKSRMTAARRAVVVDQMTATPVVHLNPQAARRQLDRILRAHPGVARTMAARKGGEWSDADVLGILEDLEALGVEQVDEQDDKWPLA